MDLTLSDHFHNQDNYIKWRKTNVILPTLKSAEVEKQKFNE
jgi:hypothetical protein